MSDGQYYNDPQYSGPQYTGPQYTGPQYSGPQYNLHPSEGGKGLAITSFILGIVSLLFCVLFLNIPLAIVAIVLGIIYLFKYRHGSCKVFAIIGVITSIVSLAILIACWSYLLKHADNMLLFYDDIYGQQYEQEFPGEDFDGYDLEQDLNNIDGLDYL